MFPFFLRGLDSLKRKYSFMVGSVCYGVKIGEFFRHILSGILRINNHENFLEAMPHFPW